MVAKHIGHAIALSQSCLAQGLMLEGALFISCPFCQTCRLSHVWVDIGGKGVCTRKMMSVILCMTWSGHNHRAGKEKSSPVSRNSVDSSDSKCWVQKAGSRGKARVLLVGKDKFQYVRFSANSTEVRGDAYLECMWFCKYVLYTFYGWNLHFSHRCWFWLALASNDGSKIQVSTVPFFAVTLGLKVRV